MSRSKAPKLTFDRKRFDRDICRASKAIENLKEDLPRAVVAETQKELDRLLAIAKANTPVLTGALKESGRVLKPRARSGGEIVDFEVIFGGVAIGGVFVDYAFVVHETHASQAFFLDNAANQILPGIADRIGRKVKIRIR